MAEIKDYIKKFKGMGTSGKVLALLSCVMIVIGISVKAYLSVVVWICIILVSPYLDRRERTGGKYGVLYFDNEVALPVHTIYRMREADKERYIGKRVTVKFPFYQIDTQGDMDTGFGVYFRIDAWRNNDLYGAAILQSLKENELIAASGSITEIRPSMLFIELEELERLNNDALIT